jgi:hypothetical protein
VQIPKRSPGKTISHHADKLLLPSAINDPHETRVGGKPIPKKLKDDSVIMFNDTK